jgi:hypothetical protein
MAKTKKRFMLHTGVKLKGKDEWYVLPLAVLVGKYELSSKDYIANPILSSKYALDKECKYEDSYIHLYPREQGDYIEHKNKMIVGENLYEHI